MNNDFRQVRERTIDALQLTAIEYEHQPTGAKHFHLKSDAAENVFLVALRTVPEDSTGVAHILEHTVLCGSERYPVRDPFFLMIRRSLNTFMNAFTGADYTAYPFASQNRKDYFNLMSVYLDAVFHSRLHPLDFAQEGHRLEFTEPGNPDSPLEYKGVVYNEMKGDMSSPLSRLYHGVQERLYPTSTYHFHSGGDPAAIPALTYQALRDFYKTHYHPSNATFMTYGNIPAEEQQEFISRQALNGFTSANSKAINVAPVTRYQAPKADDFTYPVDEDDLSDKTHIVIGWLLGRNTDLDMLLKCHLLSDALLDTSASPLRKALETTGLATAASPLCGFQEDYLETAFLCGVEGSEPENAEAVEQLVMDVLQDVAANGIPVEQVEAVLHQLELSQRELGGDGYPYGLQLILSCMPAAIHRGDPIGLLDLEATMEKLRSEVRDPAFIKQLVQELLLDNPHRVRVVMKPDRNMAKQSAADEQAALARIKASLTAPQSSEIVAQAAQLAERQAEEEDLSILPKVTRDDIPAERDWTAIDSQASPQGEVAALPAGTNGLVYHQLVRQLPPLAKEQLELLPLYGQLIGEVGSAQRDYLETQLLQHATTGGVSAFTTLRTLPDDADVLRAFFTVSSRTLNPKLDQMVSLVKDTASSARFDEQQRVRELVGQLRARQLHGVASNGHQYAMQAASAQLTRAAAINNQLTGIPAIMRLIALDDSLEKPGGTAALCTRLAELNDAMQGSGKRFLFIAEDALLKDCTQALERHWADAALEDMRQLDASIAPSAEPLAYITTTQVNYCAAAYATVCESHEDAAALSVLAGVLRNHYLHTELREKGGAYGGGAAHDASGGIFRFYSYRDPNIQETFDAFNQSIEWALQGDITDAMLEESVLGIISALDAPSSPAGEIRQAYHNNLFNRTPKVRAQTRAQHLAVRPPDLTRVAQKYLTTKPTQALLTNEHRAKEVANTFNQVPIT